MLQLTDFDFKVSYIGHSKEIPREQHYKLYCKESELIIFASTEDEAIKLFSEEMNRNNRNVHFKN